MPFLISSECGDLDEDGALLDDCLGNCGVNELARILNAANGHLAAGHLTEAPAFCSKSLLEPHSL